MDFYWGISEIYSRGFPKMANRLQETFCKYLNSADNQKIVLNGLLRLLHERAMHDGAISSSILKIVEIFDNKAQLELGFIRTAARRLSKLGDVQIDNEFQVLADLQSASKDFEFSSTRAMINDAARGFELHLGPVMVLNSRSWPFTPPFPSPCALSSFASEISKRYTEQFPGRMLRFPVNHWIVAVHDTKKQIIYEGTGVQAEVLLYLNDHRSINEHNLEPRISHSFLLPALASMVHKSANVLDMGIGGFSINDGFSSGSQRVKLHAPSRKDEFEGAMKIPQEKVAMLEAFITRLLKGRFIMKIPDIERAVIDEFMDRFVVTSEDVRQRLESLISRNFIEGTTNNRVRYVK
jgi:hypothetical protein